MNEYLWSPNWEQGRVSLLDSGFGVVSNQYTSVELNLFPREVERSFQEIAVHFLLAPIVLALLALYFHFLGSKMSQYVASSPPTGIGGYNTIATLVTHSPPVV